jgi:hypothetical protein
MLPRHRTASPETLLQVITPSRATLGVAVACLCPWDWPADLCAPEGLPCVRGHARALQALQGGQATHDTLAAHTMAVVLRGGRRPVPGSGAGGLSPGNGRHGSRTSSTPTARRTCPRWGKRGPPKPRAPGAPRGALSPPCPSAWQWPGRCLGTRTRGAALSRCLSSKRPGHPTPTPCLCSSQCPGSGQCCIGCAWMSCTTCSASHGARMSAPLAASARGPKTRRANAPGPPGPSSARRLARGPARKRPCSCSGTIPPANGTCPAWSQHTARATRCLCWLRSWGGPSLTGENATRPAIGTRCSRGRERRG